MTNDGEVTGQGQPRTTRMIDGIDQVFLRHNWKDDWYTKLDGVTPYSPVGPVNEVPDQPEESTTRFVRH